LVQVQPVTTTGIGANSNAVQSNVDRRDEPEPSREECTSSHPGHRDDAVLELARLVDDPDLTDKLEDAFRREVKVLALTIPERTAILAALDEPPAGLEELRGVLLRELAWLRAEGLA
jgi:hypothetical protein